jgi:LacI family transcriptional regulator
MRSKRVTSHDVAERAGVSRSVVSAVLNGTQGIGVSQEKRKAVVEAMRELNYHVDAQARGMKIGRSSCIAAYGDTSNALFLQLLEGVQQACAEKGYHVLLIAQGINEETREGLVDLYLQRRIDGIISLDDTSYCDENWAKQISSHGIPFVSVEGYAEFTGIASVLADYHGSIMTALHYLEEKKGCVPIYLRFYTDKFLDNWSERQRHIAYLEYCSSKEVEPQIETFERDNENGVFEFLQNRYKDGLPLLFLVNWVDGTISLYRAALRLGLTIGKDVLVMSADNTYRVNRYLVPTLTVMEIPYKAMGVKAVNILLDQMGTEQEQRVSDKYWMSAELVAGESI